MATANAQQIKLGYGDYSVGLVCALPKELTAATAMLDEIHEDLPRSSTDTNVYTLGSIGPHNIAMACLPKNRIGNVSAATVATNLINRFPAVKFVLMVGIGGGIPSKVRLGDVVVSSPIGKFPGVVQWDIGKAKEGGDFERIGVLNPPPNLLLNTLSKLETRHELGKSQISKYLEEMVQKYPALEAEYLKSESLKDELFQSGYQHVEPEETDKDSDDEEEEDEESEETGCQYCDRSKIVKRKPRGMKVHYGLIASGNVVVKDALLRKKLNKDLDGNVLCIEMEAAGIMFNLPCLVIRGICDYADSHKNDHWQKHAAAVAAAFAKEFLTSLQAEEVKGEKSAQEVIARG
ncbi:hypothetical protein TWF718_002858 [Orbilia javanica]|uniref:Nucleoside phosphorylase domain-containing protein n=1 Tax=Orbilia javanica TaxID=47235 RepID=A0AAN8RAE0_9PEZI